MAILGGKETLTALTVHENPTTYHCQAESLLGRLAGGAALQIQNDARDFVCHDRYSRSVSRHRNRHNKRDVVNTRNYMLPHSGQI